MQALNRREILSPYVTPEEVLFDCLASLVTQFFAAVLIFRKIAESLCQSSGIIWRNQNSSAVRERFW